MLSCELISIEYIPEMMKQKRKGAKLLVESWHNNEVGVLDNIVEVTVIKYWP